MFNNIYYFIKGLFFNAMRVAGLNIAVFAFGTAKLALLLTGGGFDAESE